MKRILFLFLLYPFLVPAQNSLPRFEHDTLYTTSGYNIYKGRVLQLGAGTSDAGYFKFIKFHPSLLKTNTYSLKDATLLVRKLKGYKRSGTDENTINIQGTVTYADGKKEETDIIMNFERAMEAFAGLPPELVIPENYKVNRTVITVPETRVKENVPVMATEKLVSPEDLRKILVADEIRKLFDLYKAGALTKEEYESQKKKLLSRQ